jgi:hypothetical protein
MAHQKKKVVAKPHPPSTAQEENTYISVKTVLLHHVKLSCLKHALVRARSVALD